MESYKIFSIKQEKSEKKIVFKKNTHTQSFPGGSDGKESACNVGDQGSILGQEDPLKKGMATHSSILAWRIPRTEEPGRLQSMGSQGVGHDCPKQRIRAMNRNSYKHGGY